MLQNKNFDLAIIGKNYLSYLAGLHRLAKGERVLLVDDPRVHLGGGFTSHLGEVEKQFLQRWGDLHGVAPLKNLNHYLVPCPTILHFGERRVRLGDPEPFRNLQELLSKFPGLFMKRGEPRGERGQEEFNTSLLNLSSQLVRAVEESGGIGMEKNLPPSFPLFAPLWQQFSQEYGASFLQRNLVYLAQALFQRKISGSVSPGELFHLLLSLLLPQYWFKEKELMRDLQGPWEEKGGSFKTTQVESFQIHQGRLRHIQLESFEGLICPKEVFYLGRFHPDLPFQLSLTSRIYSSLEIEIPYPGGGLFAPLAGERVVVSPPEKMGTTIPLWELSFPDSETCLAKVLFVQGPGDLPSYYHEMALQRILGELSLIFPRLPVEELRGAARIKMGHDQWVDTRQGNPREKIRVYDHFSPQGNGLVEGFTYFGPLLVPSLGPLSLYSGLLRFPMVN